MRPTRSCRIWFTPRTGSTLLSKLLADTGVAGRPEELFNYPLGGTLQAATKTDNYEALRASLWQRGCSDNGMMSVKYGIYTSHDEALLQELADLRGLPLPSLGQREAFWADIFPNPKHIYLTRRNKIRQAVSWWKAIKDEQWHLQPGDDRKALPADFYEKEYDFAALSHLFCEAAIRECAQEAYFAAEGIVPLT
ncbi:MAG: Stf0 family sulfotransferase, partial [Bacteroidota bacterium]